MFVDMKARSLYRGILKLLLTTLFAFYYLSITCFYHTHTIDGSTITHSHIHTKSHHDTQSGNHTQQSITLIVQISHFDYIDFTCNCVPNPLQFQLSENKFVNTTHWIASIYLENISLRAPPFSS